MSEHADVVGVGVGLPGTPARTDDYGMAKRRIEEARVVEVVQVTTAEGSGRNTNDPVRLVARFYDAKTGALLATGLPAGQES